MKKLGIGLLTILFAFSFASCSTNETDLETPQTAPLLKSYQLKRDASGAYSIDYNVADKTTSTTHKNLNSLTNEIHLSKVNRDVKDKYREEFSLDNNKLKIGFFDAATGKQTKLTIEDENITFGRSANNRKFLKTYGLSSNADGTIQLDFEVNANVATEFVYNEDLAIYEVHLSTGMSSKNTFSRAITVPDTGILKIDFVNHKLSGKGRAMEYVERKPRTVIIGDTESGLAI